VRAKAALREYVIDGISTNIPLHLKILDDADFQRGEFATDFSNAMNHRRRRLRRSINAAAKAS